MKRNNKLYFLVLLLALFFVTDAYAQKRKFKSAYHRGRFKNIKVSRQKAAVVCPIFEDTGYPYHGIGFKLGDPFAFTYKFYASKNFAVAIDFGSAASGLYSGHHRDNFGQNTQADTLGMDQSISYVSHKVNSEWVLEGKIFYQHDASSLLKGLQWYVGGGIQVRQLDIDYEYLLEINFSDNELGVVNVTNSTMGPVATVGIEYAYFEIPISAFMEMGGYFDVVENPGWFRFQGGVGLRYIF